MAHDEAYREAEKKIEEARRAGAVKLNLGQRNRLYPYIIPDTERLRMSGVFLVQVTRSA